MELRVRNRNLIGNDLSTIRSLIQTEGSLGRSHLSRRLCRLWQWRQSNGAYREIARRDVLRQWERRGLIELPPALHAARRAGYKNQVQAPSVVMDPIEVSLDRMREGRSNCFPNPSKSPNMGFRGAAAATARPFTRANCLPTLPEPD
jgi:hypothetical protein